MIENSLKQQATIGALWSSFQKFGISGINFVSNIILARLLSPDDYGCIGMLSIFLAVSNALIYGGFVSALIQKKETKSIDYSTVFYWNLVVAFILYVLLFLFAPYISSFYSIDQLRIVLRVQGTILITNSFSVVQTTILRKRLEFNKLAKVNLTASSFSVVVAISLAYSGAGVWSLVAQQLTMSIINCILLWYRTSWHPDFRFSVDSFKSLFSYGSFLLMNDLVNTVCDNLQGLLIGRRFNAATMGYYTQAKKLEEVPTQSISQVVTQVTFPIYAKIQDDTLRLKSAVRGTLSLMNFINFPLMILLIVIARPLFIILYSEKWLDSVPLFQVLCIAGLVNCLQSVNYQVAAATGLSKDLFIWNFVKKGVGIALMIIGLHFGVKGLLWGMVFGFYVTFLVNAKLASKTTNYSSWAQMKDSICTLLISVVAAVPSVFISYWINNTYFLFFAQLSSYILVYFLLARIVCKEELYEILSITKSVLHR